NVHYRQAYERLTSAALPPAPPLPAVPVAATGRPADVDELLRRISR
ncbi:MAG: hypothetical protein K0S88_2916, partial [Actinomycetia bacterium]|nr:hypothetical protein [Actinomycetes bacterium]